jgi:hypothetical protein
MRRRIILVGFSICLLLMPVMAGCDLLNLDFTMDIDYHTTVETSGDIIQDIRLEITGISGDLLEEAGFSEESFLGEEGWDVDIENTDDSVIITATGNYVLDEDGNISQIEGGPEVPEGMSVRVENGLLSKEYFVEFEATGGGLGELGEGQELGVLGELVLEDIFDLSWTITLPGKIVESNADTIEGSSATWDLDIGAASSGIDLTVQSHYTNWPVIGGIIGGAVAVLALVVFFFIFIMRRRGRTSAYLPGEIID